MRKFLLVFLTANALCVFGSPLFAADNPFGRTAPASVNLYDWYSIGEFADAMSYRRFNGSVYATMDDTYKEFSDLLNKAHVSDATLAAFNDWYVILKALPWDKEDYSTWTKKEQDTWQRSPVYSRFFDGLTADARKSIESRFAFWLGYHTLDLVWNLPYYQAGNYAEGVQQLISNAADDFSSFSTNPDYKSVFSVLKPEIQNAITFIASMKKKMPDPNNPLKKAGQGFTPDDVTKVVDAAKVIREAAQASQLTSA